MAFKSSYELHHHFPKLAEESGFTFNTHRPRIHIDWNKIRSIDIDNLIRERKFVLLEQNLNDILDCVLESEFDVRILDEGVMKMFRLAQLTVEYQQFCRHYLDRSVYVLREEISSLAQELDATKKDVREKDEEIRKLRKRTRHSFKTPLPYGNDNIAAMILKTLANKGENMFPSTSAPDALNYNRCGYCDKVFLNQLYLQSHISRRHPNVTEIAQRDHESLHGNENSKLTAEIMELKVKLQEMENVISNAKKQNELQNTNEVKEKEQTPKLEHDQSIAHEVKDDRSIVGEANFNRSVAKETRDVEVSTNSEENLLNKIEQWKREEHDKYNNEILSLRNQIIQTITSLKEKELEKVTQNESKAMEQLQATITQQSAEILLLKKELNNTKAKIDDENNNKEAQAQSLLWSKRAEAQTKQCELLLQKLNQVAKDAQEYRALAESEKEHAAKLQTMLQQSIEANKTASVNNLKQPERVMVSRQKLTNMTPKHKPAKRKSNPVPDRTFEQLHRKAQELLNIEASSSSSDISSVEKDSTHVIPEPFIFRTKKNELIKPKKENATVVDQQPNHVENPKKINKTREHKEKKESNKIAQRITKQETILKAIPGSPVKVVRAKLTEEVNNRLVAAGLDPLKNGIPRNIFHKQRLELQHQLELKSKKSPNHEKVRHSILAFLDSRTTDIQKECTEVNDYISPSKIKKPFKSLTSVISNVKSKALSLVKINESNIRNKRRPNTEVAKRALSLLKTPPGSETSSPLSQRHSPMKPTNHLPVATEVVRPVGVVKTKNGSETKLNGYKKSVKTKVEILNSDNENTDSSESGHNYYNTPSVAQPSSKSIDNLIKSPARRPSSANNIELNNAVKKYTIDNGDRNLLRTQSETNVTQIQPDLNNWSKNSKSINNDNSSDEVESIDDPIRKVASDENIENKVQQTKSVLKNASSTSSLNKKKVLFDMDAIQMKSVSASPSQSTKSEQYELGLINLDGEEWDISSIDNEPLKNHNKIIVNTRTSPKIAELTQTIEGQLARRNLTTTNALVGGVDLMAGSVHRAASVGGSNTSLGSSILDDSETIQPIQQKAFVKSKKITEKDDSELDISEFSIDGVGNKNESF